VRLLALLSDGFGATGGIARYNRNLIAALAQSPRISEVAVLPRLLRAGSRQHRPSPVRRQVPG
jgi:hypothetical protein